MEKRKALSSSVENEKYMRKRKIMKNELDVKIKEKGKKLGTNEIG